MKQFFAMIYKIFVKHTSLFILVAPFFVYLIDVLGVWHAHEHAQSPEHTCVSGFEFSF